MIQAAYAINLYDKNQGCAITSSSFSQLTRDAVWGARLNISEPVVATHHELALLRQCSEHALNQPNRLVHVISSYTQQQIYYLVKTLMHFGISCGQIVVRKTEADDNCPSGVWLFVEDIDLSS